MSIYSESWAWDAGACCPQQRLALVVLAKFANAENVVQMPFDAFTYYYACKNEDVSHILKSLEDDDLVSIVSVSQKVITVILRAGDGC